MFVDVVFVVRQYTFNESGTYYIDCIAPLNVTYLGLNGVTNPKMCFIALNSTLELLCRTSILIRQFIVIPHFITHYYFTLRREI